eukprot:Selendium_serpulae@DN10991_c0_g1_i1.p1
MSKSSDSESESGRTAAVSRAADLSGDIESALSPPQSPDGVRSAAGGVTEPEAVRSVRKFFNPTPYASRLVDEEEITADRLDGVPHDFLLTAKNGILHDADVTPASIEYWDMCFVFPPEVSPAPTDEDAEDGSPSSDAAKRKKKKKKKKKKY